MDINTYLPGDNEKPLDRIVDDGGFAAMFRTIAVVGDSLSSGEFELNFPDGKTHYYDVFEQSWGQYIARAMGSEVYNFSRGGMTAREYIESFAEKSGFWNPEYASQAYLVALGANDVTMALDDPDWPLGDISDISEDWQSNKPTFTGFYAAILQRYRVLSPGARFFLLTMPAEPEHDEKRTALEDRHAEIIRKLAKRFDDTYVIDLRAHSPAQDAAFKRRFYLNGHMNAMGYILTAKMVMSYMDYIIRKNPEEFNCVGMIGVDMDKPLC